MWSEWAAERGEGREVCAAIRGLSWWEDLTRGVLSTADRAARQRLEGSVVPGEEALDLICRLFDCSMIR